MDRVDGDAMRAYLEDHLAGAATVIELVDRRRRREDGGAELDRFHAELETDQSIVRAIADQFGTGPTTVEQAVGWTAEKGAQLKLRLDAIKHGDLRDLLELETMRTGVEGKKAMWRTLRTFRDDERIGAVDVDDYLGRAEQQAELVEKLRIAAAERALTS